MSSGDIFRFLAPHNLTYQRALEEIKHSKKDSHWMWYIFPQLKGLGKTEISDYYALKSINDAAEYLRHLVLGRHIIEISTVVLSLQNTTANEIFGFPDDLKLWSCMTLFANVKDTDPVFKGVLDKYFCGKYDNLTMELLA